MRGCTYGWMSKTGYMKRHIKWKRLMASWNGQHLLLHCFSVLDDTEANYRDRLKRWYVVARNVFLLLLDFSAWPCREALFAKILRRRTCTKFLLWIRRRKIFANRHCMFFGGQKVPIRPEYTSQISLENALIWHIKHISWTRVPKDLSTLRSAN